MTLSEGDAAMLVILDGYENNQQCVWDIVCDAGNVPVVSFAEFETEGSYDFLYFRDSADVLRCGDHLTRDACPDDCHWSSDFEYCTGAALDEWHGYVDTWECEHCVDGRKLYIPGEPISALVLDFTSDYSVLRAGFHAQVGCVAAAETGALVPTASCDDSRVVDLQLATSPLEGQTTTEGSDDLDLDCGSRGNEIVYRYLLGPGDKIVFRISALTFDAKLETRIGGFCPGDMYGGCTDESYDHEYINESPVPVPVYFIVDGVGGDSGEFTLAWEAVSADELTNACSGVLSAFMHRPSDCNAGLLFEAFAPWDFDYSSFQDHPDWQGGASVGDDGWLGWVPMLTTVQQGSEIWYESDQDFVDQIEGFQLYDRYVLRWRGTISIDAPGSYGFKTASDDGSMLFIGATLVVDNDGNHGTRERSGHIDLDIGDHDIVILFFENWGGSSMMVSWTPTPGVGEWVRLDAAHLSNTAGCSGLRGYKFKECATDADCSDPNQPSVVAMSCSLECVFGECADGMDRYERTMAATHAVEEHSENCRRECAAAGFCCNDWAVGSNQLISCAQACMIRKRGSSQTECDEKCTAREANPRCQTSINGFTYSHCSTCDDLDDSCPHGVQGVEACRAGCAMEAGGSRGGGFCQPAELCIPWMHIDGVCPVGEATEEQRSCLAAAGVELPSVESLEMLHDEMDWDPMDWDDTMSIDWDDVDFESDTFEILAEIGMASTDDSDTSVYYMGRYADPVVIAGIPSSHGADGQAIVRIRSVDASAGRVTFYVDTPNHAADHDNPNGAGCGVDGHPMESFSWVVGESGAFDGYIVGKLDVAGTIAWSTQTLFSRRAPAPPAPPPGAATACSATERFCMELDIATATVNIVTPNENQTLLMRTLSR